MLVPKCITALAKIASKSTNILTLSGIGFERKNRIARAMATDGQRGIILQWDETPHADYPPVGLDATPAKKDFAAVLPAQTILGVAKKIPQKSPKPALQNFLLDEHPTETVINEGDFKKTVREFRVATTDLEQVTFSTVNAIDGAAPPLEAAIPSLTCKLDDYGNPQAQAGQVRIAVNGKLMAELLLAMVEAATANANSNNTVVLTIDAHDRPIRLDARTFDSAPRRYATGVLMPVNADYQLYDGHLDPQPEKVGKAAKPSTSAPAASETSAVGTG